MQEIKFIIPNGKKEYDYIGINSDVFNPIFVFPPQYVKQEPFIENNDFNKQLKQFARDIIKIIKITQKEYMLDGDGKGWFGFQSMVWLLQDYISKGYYKETETVSYVGNNGKINWKKTIKNNSIWINNGNLIYSEFVRDKNRIDDNDILSQIYKCCLAFSASQIGFIFNIYKTENSIYKLNTETKPFLLYFLKNELRGTFRDYKKTLIKHLINIIDVAEETNNKNGYNMSTEKFEYVFEFLNNKIFGNENVKEYYGKCSYEINGINVESSSVRPDTILNVSKFCKDQNLSVWQNVNNNIKNDYYVIIDSKFYNYGYSNNTKDLPESSSIIKQIAYNKFVDNKLTNMGIKNKKVLSVFMLPYLSKNQETTVIEYVGKAIRTESDSELDKIMVFKIDLKTMVDIYFYKSKLTKEDLIKTLWKLIVENNEIKA